MTRFIITQKDIFDAQGFAALMFGLFLLALVSGGN